MADAETTREIREVVTRIIACFNAGDIPRAASLMTKNGVQGIFWRLTVDEKSRELARTSIATPEPR